MIILDTNVVSEIMKPSPSPLVVAWSGGLAAAEMFTTSVTVAEILFGVELLPKGKRREALQRPAEATIAEDFAEWILNFDELAARMFALILATRRRLGRPMGIQDAQIAAIARANGASLATRNTDDFEGCGVKVVNPWEG
jgi:predicted nucleic acid-binding protein